MADSQFYDLSGIRHTLKPGNGVVCVNNDGYGMLGIAGVYESGGKAAHGGIEVQAWDEFSLDVPPDEVVSRLQERAGFEAQRFVFGVPGPVQGNQCPVTALVRHAVNGADLKGMFPECQGAQVDNDYGLLLHRLDLPVQEDMRTIQKGWRSLPSAPTTITILGSGKGLGAAQRIQRRRGDALHRELEAGHAPLVLPDFDPTEEDLYSKLIPWWTRRYGAVNSERVLREDGLVKILRYLEEVHGYPLPAKLERLKDDSRDATPTLAETDHQLLMDWALDLKDDTCGKVVEIYVTLLARWMQSAAFFHGERRTNYKMLLAGRVLAKLAAHQYFAPRYRATLVNSFLATPEPVDQDWLQSIPIHIFLRPREEALYGAVIAAACMEM